MEPRQSSITFVGTQAGAKFEGVFEKFTADIRFDPKDLATSRFDVQIDTASVNTKDGERDDIIRGGDHILLRLGEPPSPAPEPVAVLLLKYIGQRSNMRSAPTATRAGCFPAVAPTNRCRPAPPRR